MAGNIEYMKGSIFDSTADVLVCPVNTKGVMGAGLALKFREFWPSILPAYKQACGKSGTLRIGMPWLLEGRGEQQPTRPHILCFPTKGDWRKPSKLWYIERGLGWVFTNRYWMADTHHVKSIAFPRLGCGLGGLDWADVQPLMEMYLHNLWIAVEIWSL